MTVLYRLLIAFHLTRLEWQARRGLALARSNLLNLEIDAKSDSQHWSVAERQQIHRDAYETIDSAARVLDRSSQIRGFLRDAKPSSLPVILKTLIGLQTESGTA